MEKLGYAYDIFPRGLNLDFLIHQLAILTLAHVDNTTTWVMTPVSIPSLSPPNQKLHH